MLTQEENDRNVAVLGECWDDATIDERLDLIRTAPDRAYAKELYIRHLADVCFAATTRAQEHAIAAMDMALKKVFGVK